MKIGIFGGSFNPVHKGHVKIAQDAIKELDLDLLYFVPAYKSPFKKKKDLASSAERIEMLKMVIPEKSVVSEFETNRKGTSYSIDTVKYFKNKHKDEELFLIIGSDNLYKLHKWKSIDEIVDMAKIVIFKRKGTFSKENIKKYSCILMNNSLYDFSSTLVRNGKLRDNLDSKIVEYIGNKKLYIKEIMLSMLDSKRHKHSMSVAKYCANYAKQLNYPAEKAWIAGALHDITKCWKIDQHKEYLHSLGVSTDGLKDYSLHSLTGYHWVKNEYSILDEEITNAILKHTSLDLELTTLDKIVFAADKLCEGRKYQGIQNHRELIVKDFDEGFKEIVRNNFDILKRKREISPEQKAVYERWS